MSGRIQPLLSSRVVASDQQEPGSRSTYTWLTCTFWLAQVTNAFISQKASFYSIGICDALRTGLIHTPTRFCVRFYSGFTIDGFQWIFVAWSAVCNGEERLPLNAPVRGCFKIDMKGEIEERMQCVASCGIKQTRKRNHRFIIFSHHRFAMLTILKCVDEILRNDAGTLFLRFSVQPFSPSDIP